MPHCFTNQIGHARMIQQRGLTGMAEREEAQHAYSYFGDDMRGTKLGAGLVCITIKEDTC